MSGAIANAAPPGSGPILKLDSINTFYGPTQVHFDLSIEVGRGQIVCLLGGNASGKSTTMKCILGLLRPRSGEVTLDGTAITGWPTPQIIRRGIGSVPEARRLFGGMTVRENVLMGAYTRDDATAVAADLRTDAAAVSAAGRAHGPARRHALGRRAADGGDGAGADGAATGDRAWTSRPWACRRSTSIACWS